MKRKAVVTSLLIGIIGFALVSPIYTSAFWPFDQIFGKGDVKGETTDGRRPSIVSRFLNRPTPTPVVIKEIPVEIEDEISEESLTNALKNKNISTTQRSEIQTRLRAIKAKREELKKMREAFTAWLKSNNIEPKGWGTEKNSVEEGQGRRPTVTGIQRKDVQNRRQ